MNYIEELTKIREELWQLEPSSVSTAYGCAIVHNLRQKLATIIESMKADDANQKAEARELCQQEINEQAFSDGFYGDRFDSN